MRSSMQQRRNLSIHEYLSMNLLQSVRAGSAIFGEERADISSTALVFLKARLRPMATRPCRLQRSSVRRTMMVHSKILTVAGGEDMVIKAQVLAGGRGKGSFDNGLKGGVRVIYSYGRHLLLEPRY
jgi:hypothetical protein